MPTADSREAVPTEYTWDLDALYADREAWAADIASARESIDDLRAFEGQVADDADSLAATLETYEELMRTVSNVASYARMCRDEDTRDDDAQAMLAEAQSLSAAASEAASFIEPELQQAGREVVEPYLATDALAEYDHYLDDVLRMEAHTRSPEIEALLADLGEVLGSPGEIYDTLANADMTFPSVPAPEGEDGDVEITLDNVTTLLQRQDRAFRERVHDAFYGEWATVHNAVGTAYHKSVLTDVKSARARDYDSALDASLDGPNVPVDVYDTLVETVRDRLDPLHRHARFKADHVGAEALRPWDFYVPLTETESPEIPYEEACEHVLDAVGVLGEEYREHCADGLENRWVDVYETPGKRAGAYSGGTYDSQPYILMNYQDDVSSMYTLAHELGHSMHSELTSEAQPYIYGSYEIFVAEVASTVNEVLLTRHLLAESDDDRLTRHVLDQSLERFRSTLFRQTMFAEFERQVHATVEDGDPITPDRLDEAYRDLKADYYAPAELDEHIAREWMRIPHFYRSFYVYQYATGLSAAVAIADRIDEEGADAAAAYRDFLARGSSDYPVDLLRSVGVDPTTADPVAAAIDAYSDALDRMARVADLDG
ncbi:oligoendopeptidase F [Halococcoides cellulosivorans]|uniref:Oligoendopeptidase F n=1 Tax=Halococcoides cellulosivorans TaxID=1679096 RepID=A0A2R4X252_9EURY|nr:oligoendopeptidase F [Halococcoides cellulosivorans]AWB27845.1 oligoendopeptidase F [Halococcoides cellulosivorans]